MQDIFERVKKMYENRQLGLWDIPENSVIGEKLQYLILRRRYLNLKVFLEKQKKNFGFVDIEELQELLFFYNDLNEINFIGTDMFANALFLKNKVPFLYRSVGKDIDKDKVFGEADLEYSEHVQMIFKECLNQIETGGAGKLFSYTKCFGKMLYKYATFQNGNLNTIIEVRKEAIINAISEDGKDIIGIQRYIRNCAMRNGKSELPYFTIDMSNARDNSVEYLKYWITEFLGKQEWYWHKNIVDPIGDAEVVCNFTNASRYDYIKFYDSVQRLEFSRDEFCVLLYKYFKEYATKIEIQNWFCRFVSNTLETLKNFEDGKLKCFYEKIKDDNLQGIDYKKINNILDMVNWENEIRYMSRRKGETKEQNREPSHMEVYKGDNAEMISKQWKYILFSAIERKYSYIDYSNKT
ncbi:hypothetical protein NYE33_10515 [Paenibacillus sp. FSL R10-2199]|uniref:hypothetical protein n=1 Tax=Paenibacillus sp. FSL R10-2199 TaxID=2975348 RepID=UPI0030FC8FB1